MDHAINKIPKPLDYFQFVHPQDKVTWHEASLFISTSWLPIISLNANGKVEKFYHDRNSIIHSLRTDTPPSGQQWSLHTSRQQPQHILGSLKVGKKRGTAAWQSSENFLIIFELLSKSVMYANHSCSDSQTMWFCLIAVRALAQNASVFPSGWITSENH